MQCPRFFLTFSHRRPESTPPQRNQEPSLPSYLPSHDHNYSQEAAPPADLDTLEAQGEDQIESISQHEDGTGEEFTPVVDLNNNPVVEFPDIVLVSTEISSVPSEFHLLEFKVKSH